MQRRKVGANGGDNGAYCHLVAMETKLFGLYPAIMAHLGITRLDDGSARTPGNLMVKTMGSTFIVTLKEPDEALQLQLVGPTIDDTFALAELMLSGNTAPWESDPWQKARNQKGKKTT